MIDPRSLDIAPTLGSKSYRLGVIGTGGIVSGCHLPAYQSQGWEVVRIASRSQDSARRVAEQFGIRRYSSRWEDVLEDPAVEVVDISLPSHLHPDVAKAAFAAGKHVMVQKPMANTLDEAKGMVAAAQKAGIKFAVNQNGRWDPAIRACKALADQGVFGQLITASFELRTRQPWQEYWKDAENYPRLMLLGMSIHHIDQFRFLFGEPEEVMAMTQKYPGQPWAGDSIASYAFRYANGLVAYGFDDGFPWNRDWSVKYRIEGVDAIARGDIGWPRGDFSSLEFTTLEHPDSWIRPAFSRKWFPEAFVGTMGDLFLAIENDTEPTLSGTDNLRTLRLIEAAYLSAELKRTVRIDEIPLDLPTAN